MQDLQKETRRSGLSSVYIDVRWERLGPAELPLDSPPCHRALKGHRLQGISGLVGCLQMTPSLHSNFSLGLMDSAVLHTPYFVIALLLDFGRRVFSMIFFSFRVFYHHQSMQSPSLVLFPYFIISVFFPIITYPHTFLPPAP